MTSDVSGEVSGEVTADVPEETGSDAGTDAGLDAATDPGPTCTCETDADCDDGNPCTVSECACQCVTEPVPDDTSCGPCGETCWQGVCQPGLGEPPECAGDDDCAVDDPCVTSTCECDECGWCWCEHTQIPGCGDPCDGVDCADGKPCTVDYCEAGECVNDPVPDGSPCGDCAVCSGGECMPLLGGCAADSDCDDGDPCTKDYCDSCGCHYIPDNTLPGCGEEPCDGGCDDGDPCTSDYCLLGTWCLHQYDWACEGPVCNGDGVLPTPEAAAVAGSTKVAAEATMGGMVGCTKIGCGPDNPCCNECEGGLKLVDSAGSLDVPDESWACSSDDCGGNMACEPLHALHPYWVWGATGGAVEPPPEGGTNGALIPVGWCLEATPEGLVGDYAGTLIDAWAAASAPLTLSVAHGPDAAGNLVWSVTAQTGPVPPDYWGSTVMPQTVDGVMVDGGLLTFELMVMGADGWESPTPVSLHVWRDSLMGAFGYPPLPTTVPVFLASGHLIVKRLF